MRLTGHHGKKVLQLLLDIGSTHNFIDSIRALRMDCKIEGIPSMGVRVADKGQLICDKIIRGFSWKMHSVEFKADMLLLPLSGSDCLGSALDVIIGPNSIGFLTVNNAVYL